MPRRRTSSAAWMAAGDDPVASMCRSKARRSRANAAASPAVASVTVSVWSVPKPPNAPLDVFVRFVVAVPQEQHLARLVRQVQPLRQFERLGHRTLPQAREELGES